MKTYTIEFTESEHRTVESLLDKYAANIDTMLNQMVMDGQFRAGGNKLLDEKDNEKIKKAYTKTIYEVLRAQEMLKTLRDKFEEGYKDAQENS